MRASSLIRQSGSKASIFSMSATVITPCKRRFCWLCMELYFIFPFFIGTHKLTSFVLSDLNRGIITFILHKFNVYDKKDIRNKGDSVVVGIVGKSKSLDFTTNPNLGEIQTFLCKSFIQGIF